MFLPSASQAASFSHLHNLLVSIALKFATLCNLIISVTTQSCPKASLTCVCQGPGAQQNAIYSKRTVSPLGLHRLTCMICFPNRTTASEPHLDGETPGTPLTSGVVDWDSRITHCDSVKVYFIVWVGVMGELSYLENV